MISIECNITGSQIATQLRHDEEETFYFFQTLLHETTPEEIAEIIEAYVMKAEGAAFAEYFEKISKRILELQEGE